MPDPYPRPPDVPLVPFESEAELIRVHKRMWQFAVRNRHVTIPLVIPAGLLAAGAVLAAEHATFETGIVGAAVSVTTWFTAPAKWSREPRIKDWPWTSEVAYVRSTAGGATLWLFLASIFGPAQTWLEVMLGALCLAWGGLFWWHKRPRDRRARRRHAMRVQDWNLWWQRNAPAWGAAGSGVIEIEDHGPMESLLIQLWGGRQSIATVRNLIPLLESALGGYVHHGMTRVEINRKNPSQVWLHLKREDPLGEVIEWDDSTAPDDITKPAPLGIGETGGWLRECLRRGWFVLGRTRWGKSNELSVMLATITRCRNARVLLLDMKGGRAARPWLPAVDWVATSIDEARVVLACMVAEVKARAAYAYNGEDEQLTPTDDVPTIFVVIDETYEVTGEAAGDAGCAADLAVIASQGQGVEIYPVVLSQYGALAETVRTEQTRSNLNGRMCFQTEAASHGVFALGDDANKHIDTTTLAVKGAFYFRRDSKTKPEQYRGPHFPHSLVKATARRNAEATDLYNRPLRLYCGAQPISADPGAPTWQQVYDARWSRLPAAFHRDAPQLVALGITPPPEEVRMAANKIITRPEHPEAALLNAAIDEDPDVSDAEILRARALAEARGEPVDLASEKDRRKHRFAVLLQDAPPGGITAGQLAKGSGMGRTWVHGQLKALVAAGAARHLGRPGDGRYEPTGDIWAAMEAIRREGDRLADEARQMAGV